MKKTIPLLLILAGLVALLPGSPVAENYVSLNGEFYITYPEDWYQVDYNTVDYYLFSDQANRESFQYEAVFAERKSVPFHNGNYLILTLDLVGKLDNRQVDSLLTDLDSTFGDSQQFFPSGNLQSDLKPNTVYYDRANKTVTLLNEITDEDQIVKKNIWLMKIYDKGIANFYFYSPDSVYEAGKAVFSDIVASFSTEGIEQAMPREDLKMADVNRDDGGFGITYVIILIAVLLVIVIVIYLVRKRKS
ncbi:MAG: hypothetical protein JXA92_13770 [candidate division Zixibacteria bacterium]|nr:hypothetical protein [candidate division Zixibacteria bacterium]